MATYVGLILKQQLGHKLCLTEAQEIGRYYRWMLAPGYDTYNMKPETVAATPKKDGVRRSSRIMCLEASDEPLPRVTAQEKGEVATTMNNPLLKKTPPHQDAIPIDLGIIGRATDNVYMSPSRADHTVELKKEKNNEDGPKWAPMTKQHATGLRKIGELSTIPPVANEHPGATVNNCPEKSFTILATRRLKRDELLKINWEEGRNPLPSAKKTRLAINSSPKKESHDSKAKMQQYQKEAFLFKSSFEGRIALDEIAPSFGYTFVVPGFVTFGMLSTFKCKESVDLHRRRMAKIQTAKSVYYYQLHWREGYKNSSAVKRTWRDNTLIGNTMYYTMEGYLKSIEEALNLVTGNSAEYETLCSLIETEKAVHQPGHIDDKTCENVVGEYQPWILHQPLCAEGRTLQIWAKDESGKLSPQMLHIPFGSACMLRGDIYHGGCYGNMGNIGFHAQLNPRPAEGKYLGMLPESRNEQVRETDIPANEVNNNARTLDQVKFTQKYLKNMKRMFPSTTFWLQRPEENANWPVTRLSLKTA
jgi:hypothetical protein